MRLRAFAVFLCLALALPWANATILNLTTAGAWDQQTAVIGGSFRVEQISPSSTGTGVIDSFLRIHQTGQERGYNTGANNPPLDDLAGNFTKPLQLSEIPTVTMGSVVYRQFLLDINQNTDSKLSLNQIQIFQSAADVGSNYSLTEAAADTSTATGKDALISFPTKTHATEIFRMNNDNMVVGSRLEIQLDYSLNSGSGSGDMFLYVPDANFKAANGGFVTLFSQFGSPRGAYASNDGFEEWAVLKPGDPTAVPEPATIVFLGTALCGLSFLLRKRRAA